MAYFDVRISVGLWSVCCRFVIGLSSRLSVCCRLRVQHCADDRFSIGVMSVIYRSQIGRFHTESYPTWTRLVLRCLQQHCRWPTAGRFIEKFVFFVGFVSVWPVWLGYYVHQGTSYSGWSIASQSWQRFYTLGNINTYALLLLLFNLESDWASCLQYHCSIHLSHVYSYIYIYIYIYIYVIFGIYIRLVSQFHFVVPFTLLIAPWKWYINHITWYIPLTQFCYAIRIRI